jgi:DNA-binding Lrp family transcriptional regulator
MNELDRHLLNDFQRGLPLSPRPYADMAQRLGVSEEQVIERLRFLQEAGQVSRVGAVIRPHSLGVSTLAALAVPPERLEAVAALISAYAEVNHNYQREHHYNLWFVVTCDRPARLRAVLDEIQQGTGLRVLDLPLLEDYHIDLGFELQWT